MRISLYKLEFEVFELTKNVPLLKEGMDTPAHLLEVIKTVRTRILKAVGEDFAKAPAVKIGGKWYMFFCYIDLDKTNASNKHLAEAKLDGLTSSLIIHASFLLHRLEKSKK